MHVVDADLTGDDGGGGSLVSRQHGQLGDAETAQARERRLGVRARHVTQDDPGDEMTVDRHVRGHFIRREHAETGTDLVRKPPLTLFSGPPVSISRGPARDDPLNRQEPIFA